MNIRRAFAIIALLAVAAGASSAATFFVAGRGGEEPREFATLAEVVELIEAGYVNKAELEPGDLETAAIRGIIEALDDPYTSYASPAQAEVAFDYTGAFDGIGAEVNLTGDQVLMHAPLPNSPAERAGLLPGGVVLAVDGQSLFHMTLLDAVALIRGPKGTIVTLRILRPGNPDAFHVEVAKFNVSRLYDRNQIILRLSAEEVREKAYHSWAVRPSEMITDAVEGYLKESRLFTDIRQDFVDVIPQYRITGTIKSLERLDSGDQWYANFRLSVQLVDGRNAVVTRWDFDDEAERVYHRDFVHTVSAFNELLRRFMYRVVRDMDHMFLIRKLQRENRPYQHILDVPNGRATATADTAATDSTRDTPHPDYDIIPGKGL